MTGWRDGRALIDDLVDDLAPVRRFPRPSVALAGVFVTWLVAAVLAWRLFHPSARELAGRLSSEWPFGLVLVGLAVAAAAGCAAAIAGVIPGRETAETGGRRVAWAGLALCVGAGVVATLVDPGQTPLRKDVACFVLGAAVGVPPALALVVLERWGVVQRPARSAALALLGAFALGGVAVQIGCHDPGARHVLLGHVGIPVVVTAIGLAPLLALVRRFAARRRSGR